MPKKRSSYLEGKIAVQDKQITALIKELSSLRSLIEAPDPKTRIPSSGAHQTLSALKATSTQKQPKSSIPPPSKPKKIRIPNNPPTSLDSEVDLCEDLSFDSSSESSDPIPGLSRGQKT